MMLTKAELASPAVPKARLGTQVRDLTRPRGGVESRVMGVPKLASTETGPSSPKTYGQWAGVRRQPSEMEDAPRRPLARPQDKRLRNKQDESACGASTQENPRYWIALVSASELASLGGRSDRTWSFGREPRFEPCSSSAGRGEDDDGQGRGSEGWKTMQKERRLWDLLPPLLAPLLVLEC